MNVVKDKFTFGKKTGSIIQLSDLGKKDILIFLVKDMSQEQITDMAIALENLHLPCDFMILPESFKLKTLAEADGKVHRFFKKLIGGK